VHKFDDIEGIISTVIIKVKFLLITEKEGAARFLKKIPTSLSNGVYLVL
jgi:hypothetical protein